MTENRSSSKSWWKTTAEMMLTDRELETWTHEIGSRAAHALVLDAMFQFTWAWLLVTMRTLSLMILMSQNESPTGRSGK